VAAGSHAQLMTSSTIYREIYDSQLGNGFTLVPSAAGRLNPSALAGGSH
jgi:hypothetical protein